MTDSFIDPKTGEPAPNTDQEQDPNNQAQTPVSISSEEWHNMKTRLDVYERQFAQQAATAQQPAPVQAQPTGPTFEAQSEDLEKQIDALDDKIEKAIENGQSVRGYRKQQRKLQTELTQLTIEYKAIEPLRQQGMQTLTYLTSEVTRSKMPYYDLVKDDMKAFLGQLAPEQRADPKIQELAYKSCVGDEKVLSQILKDQKEAVLREAAAAPAPDISGNGRQQDNPKVPSPSKILGPQAMAALREKGVSADQHYKTFGFEGWADYWEKKGKIHFQDFITEES